MALIRVPSDRSVLEAGHLGWAEDILNGEEGQLIRGTGDPAWVERLHIFRHRIQELRTLEGEGGVGSLVREDHPMTALLQDTDARLKAFAATKQVLAAAISSSGCSREDMISRSSTEKNSRGQSSVSRTESKRLEVAFGFVLSGKARRRMPPARAQHLWRLAH